MDKIFLAIGLVLIFEGAIYALFPKAMQDVLETMRNMPLDGLRNTGLTMAVLGAAVVYLVERFS